MVRIDRLLQTALLPDSPTPRLDAELLLAHVLARPRSVLHAWPEQLVAPEQVQAFEQLMVRRRAGEPVAYLLGQQGFWDLQLEVSKATLIPRPETELLVSLTLEHCSTEVLSVLDLGTGTGAIALALAHARPHWQITGTDRVGSALELAQRNAQRLGLSQVRWVQSDWFAALEQQHFGVIVSNPPYIAAQDSHLSQGDLRFEPASALVASEDGLADLRRIISQAPQFLYERGWLLVEHGHMQAHAVQAFFIAAGFTLVRTVQDWSGQPRVCMGQWTHAANAQ